MTQPVSGDIVDIFCDESCHLPNDGQTSMVLGALWIPHAHVRRVADEVRALKVEHHLSPQFEIKWTKVSPGGLAFYERLVDLFFNEAALSLRAVVATGKAQLDHSAFGQTHDEWYYKMYYTLLLPLLSTGSTYRIYIDIKDTHGGPKAKKLREVLSNSLHDFDGQLVERIQIVRSDQVEVLQLADLLIGAVSYVSRGLHGNAAKVHLATRISALGGRPLDQTTPLSERKINLLRWTPQQAI